MPYNLTQKMPRLYNKWLPWKLRETQDKPRVWNHYLECPWPTFSNSWLTLFGQALCCWGGDLKQHMLHKQKRSLTVSEEIQPNRQWALLCPSPKCSFSLSSTPNEMQKASSCLSCVLSVWYLLTFFVPHFKGVTCTFDRPFLF